MTITKHNLYNFCLVLTFLLPITIGAQELRIFSKADFNLIGNVKKSTVITNYGKEEFYFNKEGKLTKSITRYTDEDYSITYYKYSNNEILEKRLENYRDGVFDKNTSIAHLYKIDTTENKKVTEKILTYSKKFLDQYEYEFDAENRLKVIKRINDEEIDETTIEYTVYGAEKEQAYYLNGKLLKSIRESYKTNSKGEKLKTVLTKEFIKGKPLKAEEVVTKENGSIVSKDYFTADAAETKFVFRKKEVYTYKKDNQVIDKITVKTAKKTYDVTYLHQFDGENGNWIKQVISPDNTYITRKIQYYPEEVVTEETIKN
ncbi:hypothetical protein [Cellulophaga fucicola]|uniref:hypothetical protein n=1 Tax=Cellulophaga fucicola TaxID=76595 RepID=UPI003EBC85FE